MIFISIYRVKEAPEILYELLRSRKESVNISHKKLPSFSEHKAFIKSHPYKHWEFVRIGKKYIGAIYLTYIGEIGLHVFPEYDRRAYETKIVKNFMARHERVRYLANVSPTNRKAAMLFRRLGFKQIQHTYELSNESK